MRTASFRSLPSDSQAVVTLAQVRCGPRALNEYVDSPRPPLLLPLKSAPVNIGGTLPIGPTSTTSGPGHSPRVSLPARNVQRLVAGGVAGGGVSSNATGGSSIISQPSKSLPAKEEGGDGDGHSSIICSKCKKCRCAACTEPRQLPSQWCCGDRYELSARKALDCCTCFCCVQTAFYHCGAEEDNACYDDPCACGGSKCCGRWLCMAGAALFLPCLWMYWPLRGCLAASTACYNSCRKKGCQCSRQQGEKTGTAGSKHSQSRRLLIESDSSSA